MAGLLPDQRLPDLCQGIDRPSDSKNFRMITCDRCKTENLEGSQYCDECGAPLRPNLHQSLSDTASLHVGGDSQNGQNGQNGSRSAIASPKPEWAAGHSGAALNVSSSLNSTPRTHARLVIERGRSIGKQFMLSDLEAQIGRWDADGGIFPR